MLQVRVGWVPSLQGVSPLYEFGCFIRELREELGTTAIRYVFAACQLEGIEERTIAARARGRPCDSWRTGGVQEKKSVQERSSCDAKEVQIDFMLFADDTTLVDMKAEMNESVRWVRKRVHGLVGGEEY